MRFLALSALVVSTLAGAAMAQLAGVNGLHQAEFNGFNSFPASSRAWTNAGLGGVRLQEGVDANQVGTYANRHFAFLSSDLGATSYAYDGVSSFSISTTLTMHHTTSQTGVPNYIEGGIHFLMGGETHPYDDGGLFVTGSGTAFVAGMGAGFNLLAEGNGSNVDHPALTADATYLLRFDYWAPGALGSGSLASYMATIIDTGNGNYQQSPLTAWDQGSSWPGGLIAGTAIGFRFQNQPTTGLDNTFDTQYGPVVIGPAVPTPGAAALLGVAGLMGFRRRRA